MSDTVSRPALPRVLVLAAVVVAVLVAAARGSAATDRAHWADGYVWAHSPTGSSYTPSTFYSFNRAGRAITITRPAGTTGRYRVKFAGLSSFLGSKSVVHVTGYLADTTYCKPMTATLVKSVVEVRCFEATTGAAKNAYFNVLVTRNYADDAFAYAHKPTSAKYAPAAASTWNPGGTTTVSRSAKGVYSVTFKGLGPLTATNGGHFQVNGVGTKPLRTTCKVGGWGGSPDLVVSVRCLNRNGKPVDAPFTVLFTLPSDHVGYAWADQPSSATYTPSSFYSWNPAAGANSIARLGTGRYSVNWTGLDPQVFEGGDVQVTAYGGGNAQCKVEGWGSQSATVRCFTATGTLVDSFFDVLLGS